MVYDKAEPDIEKFFTLRGIAYNKDTGVIVVPSKCRWLNNQNKCIFYSRRPYSCKQYECEKLKNLPGLHYSDEKA